MPGAYQNLGQQNNQVRPALIVPSPTLPQGSIAPPAGSSQQASTIINPSLSAAQGSTGISSDELYGKPSKFIKKDNEYVIQKYNDIEHQVLLYLDNSGDMESKEENRFYINPGAILGLHVCDTVNDWVVNGSLTFAYMPEGITTEDKEENQSGQTLKTAVDGIKQAAQLTGNSLKNYNFRGDGYDLLRVLIMPKTKNEANESQTGKGNVGEDLTITETNTEWMLSYLFSVYEIEDVNNVPELEGTLATYIKCLKLHFHDVRYEILKTTNQEYSTAKPKNPDFIPNLESQTAPKQGVLYTGEALKDIFNAILTNKDYNGSEEFAIPKDEKDWEKGSSQIFYTSPATYSAADDIEYIFGNHVSDTLLKGTDQSIPANDLSLLHTDRAPKFGFLEPIHLTPLSNFFKKAGSKKDSPGELQKEHFFITSVTRETTTTDMYRAPMGAEINSKTDLKMTKFGEIISYSFVDMSPSTNSTNFRTTPVCTTDIGMREFSIEFSNNKVTDAKKIIAESYIKELFTQDNDPVDLYLPTIHKTKEFSNSFPVFSLNSTSQIMRARSGLHNLLYTGLFQNACICFKVYGLTYRESGTFIGIDKTEGCSDNDYNNKLYGQWFVVKVDHLFQAGAYMNIIYAVKLHRFKKLKQEFKNTLKEIAPIATPIGNIGDAHQTAPTSPNAAVANGGAITDSSTPTGGAVNAQSRTSVASGGAIGG